MFVPSTPNAAASLPMVRIDPTRCGEAIAFARQGLDVEGLLTGVAEGLAPLHHSGVERVVEIDECIGRPEPCSQIFPGDNLAGVLEQVEQEL